MAGKDVDDKGEAKKLTDLGTSIWHLPADCIKHIYGFLKLKDRLIFGQVCESWKEMDDDDIVWQICHIHHYDFYIEKLTEREIIKVLSRAGPYLTSLTIDIGNTAERVQVLQDNCHSLKSLTIHFLATYESDYDGIVSNFFIHLRNLRSIALHGTPRSFWRYANTIPEIVKSMDLYGGVERSNISLNLLPYQNLNSLVLAHLSLRSNDLGAFECLNVQSLTLYDCPSTEGFSARVSELRTLRSFDIDSAWNFGNEELIRLLENSPGLKNLSIRLIRFGISIQCMRMIAGSQLTHLKLRFLQLHENAHLIGTMVHLEELDVSEVRNFSPDIVRALVKNSTKLRKLSIYDFRKKLSLLFDVHQLLLQNCQRAVSLEWTVDERYESRFQNWQFSPLLIFEFVP